MEELNEEELLCGYCGDFFKDPVNLSCGHLMCLRCVETLSNFSLLQLPSIELKSKPTSPTTTTSTTTSSTSPITSPTSSPPILSVEIKCCACLKLTKVPVEDGCCKVVPKLQKNQSAKTMAEAAIERRKTNKCVNCGEEEAKHHCPQCSQMSGMKVDYCEKCWTEAHKLVLWRNHTKEKITSTQVSRNCPDHKNRPFELLYKTDK